MNWQLTHRRISRARAIACTVAGLATVLLVMPGQAAAQYAPDYDGDGLSDADEYYLGTYPDYTDSDGDGLTDGDEVFYYGTYPTYSDSDGDGYSDGNEVATGYSPLVPAGIDTSGGGTYVTDSTGYYEDIIVSESIRAAGEADRENWEETTCNAYMEDNSC